MKGQASVLGYFTTERGILTRIAELWIRSPLGPTLEIAGAEGAYGSLFAQIIGGVMYSLVEFVHLDLEVIGVGGPIRGNTNARNRSTLR